MKTAVDNKRLEPGVTVTGKHKSGKRNMTRNKKTQLKISQIKETPSLSKKFYI